MAGSAKLGTNLVDRLQPLADRMRRLEGRFGLRHHVVSRVWRRWGGARRGEGSVQYLLDEVLDPAPIVEDVAAQYGTHYELQPGGRVEVGDVIVRQVSLTYTEGDLTGPAPLAPTDEWYFRVAEGHGQEIRTMFYVLAGVPVPDRLKTMGWIMQLRRTRLDE